MSETRIVVLVAHPKPALFKEFRRLCAEGRYPPLSPHEVGITFASIRKPGHLQSLVTKHRPDVLIVHGSLLGDQPAYAAMWVLTQGVAGVLITGDSDRSRQFETKRCHVLPITGTPDETAAALAAELARVQDERG